MTDAQANATRIIARIAGPYLIFIAIIMFSLYEQLPLILPAFAHDKPLLLVTGAFTTVIGLTALAFHHHLTSIAAIVVTVLAALITLRGVMLGLTPELVIGMATQVARNPIVMLVATALSALLGIYLTFVGWVAKRA
ncbi:hypothetical protein [Terricaulis sp.]|uniref:hypothetical protein n=1 Tax=Terricaulis sp. TaxID=2768686 RepID=UPI003784B185